MNLNDRRLLTRGDILALVQISRSTLRSMVDGGIFPSPVRVGRRAVRWRAQDIADWLDQCPDARPSPEELRVMSSTQGDTTRGGSEDRT